MNTVRSVWYGWGTLVVAGGASYYFAKRSINADRAERAAADSRKRAAHERLREYEYNNSQADASPRSTPPVKKGPVTQGNGGTPRDESGNPSHEASQDPAPIGHEPVTEGQRVRERSKYESSEVFRSRKGDRFS